MKKYKTFVINLANATERRKNIEKQLKNLDIEYEIIDAIYGKDLNKESPLAHLVDWEWADANAFWVSKGLLACTLSHLKACKAVIEQNLDYGLILEDDTWLTSEIPIFLEQVGTYLQQDEAILLYYSAWNKCTLSTKNALQLSKMPKIRILYPTKNLEIITANAYILSREACQKLIDFQTPMKATSDSWKVFMDNGAIQQIRCTYPFLAKAADFKSTIDYIDNNSWKGKVLNWIDKYKIPIIYQYLKYRRRKLREVMLNIELVDYE
jgi:glycosyl transferase family 25